LLDLLPPMYAEYRLFSPLYHLYAFVGGFVVYVAVRRSAAPTLSRTVIIRCLNVLSLGMIAFLIWRGNSG